MDGTPRDADDALGHRTMEHHMDAQAMTVCPREPRSRLQAAREVAALLLVLAAVSWRVHRADAQEQMAEPVRLTAGAGDEMMGQLNPDGTSLFFASNARSTWQIFVQDMTRGAPRPLFEYGGDALDPRISPDGRRVLYLSFLTDATGDVCVYDLAQQQSRCLTDDSTSESQAFWFPDGEHIGVVSRAGMHADFQLLELSLTSREARVLIDRNLAAPAVSPDGRWLVFVPVDRSSTGVGVAFSRRAARTLALVRLDAPEQVLQVRFDLPGASGFPAFSPDGRYLYFSQFLNDTNLDGVIDGDDHSVLFRVPFEPTADRPVTVTRVEQLTNARWNCQYPVPGPDRLLATCAHQGSLDIYALPLHGSVPETWGPDRLEDELDASRDTWQKLLILSHLLRLQDEDRDRVRVLRRIVQAHLELGEYESAEYFARQIVERYPGVDGGNQARLMRVVLELVGERKETQRLVQGELNLRFIQDQQDRLERLLVPARDADPAASAMARIVASEVNDTIGEKGAALTLLQEVDPNSLQDPFVIAAYGRQAAALYRELGMQDALLGLFQALSEHPNLPARERMEAAQDFVRTLTRGVGHAEKTARVDAWLERTVPDSSLNLVLEAEAWLLKLTPDNEEEVRKGLYELYRKNKSLERRRALVEMIVAQAVSQDSDYLLYEFSNSWVSWLKRASSERRYAEALYREVLLARVYVSERAGRFGDARGYAYALTRQVDALEAHIAFIENWEREGRGDVAAQYAKRYRNHPDDPVHAFVQAYLQVRDLEPLVGEARAEGIARAREYLDVAAQGLPRRVEVAHLRGHVAHLEFLLTGDAGLAQEANTHYLLALDLARDNPRYRATILQGLGLLQAAVDSHRLALDYFEQRDRLPYIEAEQTLCILLGAARSLFHAGRLEEAAARADRAVDWVAEHEGLERFEPLALLRSALYHYAAGQDEVAWQRYQALEEWAAGLGNSEEAVRTRVQVLVGRGAVAQRLGKHTVALEAFAEAGTLLEAHGDAFVVQAQASGREVTFGPEQFEPLLDGLRAHSLEALGRWDEASTAMARRKKAFEARFRSHDLDEDLWEVAAACHHLARYAYRKGDMAQALEAVEEGWVHARRYDRRTGFDYSDLSLTLLADFAALRLYGKVPSSALSLNLHRELRAAYQALCERRNPARSDSRFLFELYLTMMEVGR